MIKKPHWIVTYDSIEGPLTKTIETATMETVIHYMVGRKICRLTELISIVRV